MPPRKVPPLSSLQPRKEDSTIPVTPGSSAFPPSSFRPKSVLLVLGGGSSVSEVNSALNAWAADGFGRQIGGQKAPITEPREHEERSKQGDVTAKLSAVVYELPRGAAPDVVAQIESARKSPNNLPITTVTPLAAPELPSPLPAPEAIALSFRIALPPLSEPLRPQADKWLRFLAAASEKDTTVELQLAPDGEVATGEERGLEQRREELEELLGKSYEAEVGERKEVVQDENEQVDLSEATKGVRIVLDGLGGPPNLQSSQLLRSKALEEWTGFISRIALHPRVYLKMSPLLFPSALPVAASSGGGVTGALASAASSAAGAVGLGASYVERRVELRRRLRILLNIAYEAFGEDRITFATSLAGCGVKPTKGSAEAGAPPPPRGTQISVAAGSDDGARPADEHQDGAQADEQLTAAEEWYELCRETFQQIGLGDQSLDKIFNENAAHVYRI